MNVKKLMEYPNKDLLSNWDKLSSLPREEVVEISKEWSEIHAKNIEIHNKNMETKADELEKIESNMKSAGIDIYKWKTIKLKREKNGFKGWFNTNVVKELDRIYGHLTPSIPKYVNVSKDVNGVKVSLSIRAIYLLEGYDEIIAQIESAKPAKKENIVLDASVDYANKNNIDILGLSDNEIINKVDEIARENFRKEEYPDGTVVELDSECDYCETYVVGERRCECGNRRIAMTVDGDLLSGFYCYPEGY